MTNSKQPSRDEPAADNIRSWLRQGIRAARAADRAEARRCFQAAHAADPNNIIALLWLAWLAATRQESLALLSRVLELDPKNEHAHAGIRWARHCPPCGDDGVPASCEDHTAGAAQSSEIEPAFGLSTPRDTLRSPEIQEDVRKGVVAQRARRLIGPLSLLLAAACLFVVGVVLVAWYSSATVLASLSYAEAMLSTATPTVTPTLTPTFTATPTPSPTPTVTPTYTPSPTPTCTPSPTPTATPTLTPTATASPTQTATVPPPPPPPPTATPVPPAPLPSAGSAKWIDVDLTYQRLTAYQGDIPVFQALVSTGLPGTPTVVGQFRIYWKLLASDMAGPGYYLPRVPYTMYFYRGYALHGTYWHNNFGRPMSHGCVNLRTADAQWLFNWSDPSLPAGVSQTQSSSANPGTLVVVHY